MVPVERAKGSRLAQPIENRLAARDTPRISTLLEPVEIAADQRHEFGIAGDAIGLRTPGEEIRFYPRLVTGQIDHTVGHMMLPHDIARSVAFFDAPDRKSTRLHSRH